MNVLALLVVLSSTPSLSEQSQALEPALRACGMQQGDKVTLGLTLEHGKVKSVRPVFKSVADAAVRECVVDAVRAHRFVDESPDRFTVVVAM